MSSLIFMKFIKLKIDKLLLSSLESHLNYLFID